MYTSNGNLHYNSMPSPHRAITSPRLPRHSWSSPRLAPRFHRSSHNFQILPVLLTSLGFHVHSSHATIKRTTAPWPKKCTQEEAWMTEWIMYNLSLEWMCNDLFFVTELKELNMTVKIFDFLVKEGLCHIFNCLSWITAMSLEAVLTNCTFVSLNSYNQWRNSQYQIVQ